MIAYQRRIDGTVPDGAMVFIGDSLVQGICTDAIGCPSVNYGIGGDTTTGVLGRIRNYRSLSRASVVILAVGLNDMRFRSNESTLENYTRILEAIPPQVPVICCAVLPIDEPKYHGSSPANNSRIRDLNRNLQDLCSSRPNCRYVDVGTHLVDNGGNLSVEYEEGDGLHLNSRGSQIWIREISNVLKAVREAQPKERGSAASLNNAAVFAPEYLP